MPLAEITPRNNVEPGTYEGVVVSVVKDVIVPRMGNQAGQNVNILRWTFDIGADHNVESITGRDPSSEKSNLFKYFVALIGPDRTKWAEVEQEDLVGRKALVTVSLNDEGWERIDGVTAQARPRPAPVSPLRETVSTVEDDPTATADDLPF
jgi:hypothetical protein